MMWSTCVASVAMPLVPHDRQHGSFDSTYRRRRCQRGVANMASSAFTRCRGLCLEQRPPPFTSSGQPAWVHGVGKVWAKVGRGRLYYGHVLPMMEDGEDQLPHDAEPMSARTALSAR